jgi:hypothetical protein
MSPASIRARTFFARTMTAMPSGSPTKEGSTVQHPAGHAEIPQEQQQVAAVRLAVAAGTAVTLPRTFPVIVHSQTLRRRPRQSNRAAARRVTHGLVRQGLAGERGATRYPSPPVNCLPAAGPGTPW